MRIKPEEKSWEMSDEVCRRLFAKPRPKFESEEHIRGFLYTTHLRMFHWSIDEICSYLSASAIGNADAIIKLIRNYLCDTDSHPKVDGPGNVRKLHAEEAPQ